MRLDRGMKPERLILALAMSFIMLSIVFAAESPDIQVISTYAGQPARVIAETGDIALNVFAEDPNGAVTVLGVCRGTCEYSYMPALYTDGEYKAYMESGTVRVYEMQFLFGREIAAPQITLEHFDEEKRITIDQSTGATSFEITSADGYVYEIETSMKDGAYSASLSGDMEVAGIRVKTNDSIINSEIERLDRRIRFKDGKEREVIAKIRTLRENLSGKSDLEFTFENMTVQKMIFASIERSSDMVVLIEDVPLTVRPGAKAAYAIDPTGVNFSYALVSAVAKGTVLYKCKEYDFYSQECFGEWSAIRMIVPGEEYTFTLTPEDPVFAEGTPESLPDSCVYSDQSTIGDNDQNVNCKSMVNASGGSYADMDDHETNDQIAIMNLNFLNKFYSKGINSVSVTVRYMRVTKAGIGATYAYVDVLDGGSFVQACLDTSMTIGSYETYTCSLSSYITTESELNNITIRLRTDTRRSGAAGDYGTAYIDYAYISVDYDESRPPVWSSVSATPISSSYYNKSRLYYFNTTWTDDFGMKRAILENNFTGSARYSVMKNTSSRYYNATGLAAGYYYYRSIANDTSDNTNQTGLYYYTVEKAEPMIRLFLNSSESDIRINNSGELNITGITVAGEASIEILMNGTLLNSSKGRVSVKELFDTLGDYNITLRHNSTQNFTADTVSYTVLVRDTIPPGMITDLANISRGESWLNWTWKNPADTDHVEVWLNGTNVINTIFEGYNASGLSADSWYFMNVRAVDEHGNKGQWSNLSAKTLPTTDFIPPKITDVRNSSITVTTADITWETDEISDSLVRYGTASGSYPYQEFRSLKEISHSITLAGLEPSTIYYYVVNSTDIGGNSNQSREYSFTTLNDTDAPAWSDIETYPFSPATYNHSRIYNFSIRWTDNVAVETALIEHNFTGTLRNYTMQNASDIFYHETELAAGYYKWRYFANDSTGNLASVGYSFYTVNKKVPDLRLYLNGSESDSSILQGGHSNATAVIFEPFSPYIEMFRNSSLIASGSIRAESIGIYYEPATYNITAAFNGSMNYSAFKISYILNVNDSRAPQIDLVSPEDEYVDTDGYSIFIFNAEDYSTFENCSLKLNGTIDQTIYTIENGENQIIKNYLPNGHYAWNIECYDAIGQYNETGNRTLIVNALVVLRNISATTTSNWNDADAISITAINATGGTTETNSVARTSIEYILWTNFSTANLPLGTTITSVSWNSMQLASNTGLNFYRIDWYDGSGYDNTGCTTSAITTSYAIKTCDLTSRVGTVQEANDISIRYHVQNTANQARTITIDYLYVTIAYVLETTEPVVSLSGMGTAQKLTRDSNITVGFSVTEDYLDYCELWSDFTGTWKLNRTISSPSQPGENSYNYTLPHGQYIWNVICFDYTGNNGTSQNATFNITDIVGSGSTLNATGIDVNLSIDGTPLDIWREYAGNLRVDLYNKTEPIAVFYHNFTDSWLNLSSITAIRDGFSRAVNIPGHDNITMFLPVVDLQCNVNVCEGALYESGCDGSNYTLYPDPVNGFCNITIDGTWAEDAPDKTNFRILSSSITYDSGVQIEGRSLMVNATLENLGNTKVRNLLIGWYDISHGTEADTQIIDLLNPKSSTRVTGNWTAEAGKSTIRVSADPQDAYGEYDETDNNASVVIDIPSWQYYYGAIFGNYSFESPSGTAFSWPLGIKTGKVMLADKDSVISWQNLSAFGRTKSGGASSDDFTEIDELLNSTGFIDSVASLYSSDGTAPLSTKSFTVAGRTINDVPIALSTDNANFTTGILWDSQDDSNGEFDVEREDLIFISEISDNTRGKFEVYDYEIRVPALLREYKAGEDTLLIYVELR